MLFRSQSHVRISFDIPEFTGNVTGLSTTRLLEAIRHDSPEAKFYQASSSEMFGFAQEVPQKEITPFHPRSPYGIAKVYAYWMTVNYRESYGMYTCNGILFNHESSRRGENFVTRKITIGLANIISGKMEKLYLGNLDAQRDWGYAKDYVEGMWLMLHQETPDNYVLATGETHTVREFVENAFKTAGYDIAWEGEGVNTKGMDKKSGKVLIEVSPEFYRPAEVEILIGNPAKAVEKIGWKARTKFEDLVGIMVAADLRRVEKELR